VTPDAGFVFVAIGAEETARETEISGAPALVTAPSIALRHPHHPTFF